MPSIKTLKTVASEYGFKWLINRSLYSLKLKTMSAVPATDRIYEKKTPYPKRVDLFCIDTQALKAFLKNNLSDQQKAELINTADKACEGIITGFSSIELDYGNPIDWQLNPLTGKRCDPKQKWYKIPDFSAERGDIKAIWEASRFSHFITLARAYLLTDDEKYYRAFSSQLDEWLEKNPYSYGANYKCGQECSLRMINALLAFTVFDKTGVATDSDTGNIKNLIDRCYRKILSNFFYAHKCIKNNHTISELMGMIAGAWCCDDPAQLDRAYRWLDEVIEEQFTDDGGYIQFSFNYQRLALQDIGCILSMSGKTERNINGRSQEKVKKAAMLMYQCQDDSGDMPNYGANDGALVFPVTACGYRDFRPVVNTIYALTSGKQLYSDGCHQEELTWFSGGIALDKYLYEHVERVSSQFLYAGLFTLRMDDSWAMIVSNDYHSRPGHMDQLHLDLWVDGVNVLCDVGTYSYASDEGKELVRNSSHNTAHVENKLQMSINGPFLIYGRSRRKLGRCDAERFSGECISSNGYRQKRTLKAKGNSYVITDKVDRDYTICFHTPCEIAMSDGVATLSTEGRQLCSITSNGELKVQKAERSLYYLQKEEIRCLSISGKAEKETKTTITIQGEHR